MSDQYLEQVKAEATASVQQDADLRLRVRDLTLRTLQQRKLDTQEMRQVARAVTEGISLGLGQRGGEVKGALREALAGLDEALAKAAEASQLALRQLVSQGKEFGEQDVKQALEQLRKLEGDFLDTLSTVADSAGDKVRQELKDFAVHARRAGTDTGARVAATVEEFSNRVNASAHHGKQIANSAMHEMSTRLAEAASGFFAALAEALHEKSKK